MLQRRGDQPDVPRGLRPADRHGVHRHRPTARQARYRGDGRVARLVAIAEHQHGGALAIGFQDRIAHALHHIRFPADGDFGDRLRQRRERGRSMPEIERFEMHVVVLVQRLQLRGVSQCCTT